jgi:hypothetical protein
MSFSSIMKDVAAILTTLSIDYETGVYTAQPAPATFCVIIPGTETPECADDIPDNVVSTATIELYSTGNYLDVARKIMTQIVDNGLTLEGCEFVEKEPDTGYNHYAIDVSKTQTWEDIKWQQ